MSGSYYLQTTIGLIAGIVMSAAWWYAAIKFPRVWIFSSLAIVATISILLHSGVLLLVASGQSGLVGQLSGLQVILYLVEAVLFILLVRWLVGNLKDQSKP
jgi:hypothetical protein